MVLFINSHKTDIKYNDFFTFKRDSSKRGEIYDWLVKNYSLDTTPILYLEFGVATGLSFMWWVKRNTNVSSNFFGFDTFEGLPENWGLFHKKGALHSHIPQSDDERVQFIKGLFQDTLPNFIQINQHLLRKPDRMIVHMDADLYSATLFALMQLFPFFKKGDIIIFDEFNVATHEFKAFEEFVDCTYIKLRPIAAANNFYQTVFIVE